MSRISTWRMTLHRSPLVRLLDSHPAQVVPLRAVPAETTIAAAVVAVALAQVVVDGDLEPATSLHPSYPVN